MTKSDIINEISNKTGVDKNVVSAVLESFMTEVKEAAVANESVFLRGFGSFIVKERKQKVARNISKNTTITIPAHFVPAFKPAKIFVDSIKNK